MGTNNALRKESEQALINKCSNNPKGMETLVGIIMQQDIQGTILTSLVRCLTRGSNTIDKHNNQAPWNFTK